MSNALPLAAEVGVIGAGAMGAGIAQIAAMAGHRVCLFDTGMGAADRAKAKIGETLNALAAKGKVDSAQAKSAADRIVRAGPDRGSSICFGKTAAVAGSIANAHRCRAAGIGCSSAIGTTLDTATRPSREPCRGCAEQWSRHQGRRDD